MSIERKITNKLLILIGLIGLTGCTTNACPVGSWCGKPFYENQPMAMSDTNSVPQSAPAFESGSNDNTPADYKRWGERNPRDQHISKAGIGDNLSASIPPTIDSEVEEYEVQAREMSNDSENYDDEYSKEMNSAQNENQTDEVAQEDWLAEEGSNVKYLLKEWCDKAGWRVIWNTNRNYTLNAGAMFRGSFTDVSSALIRAFARAKPAPVATYYKGNRVLVVETLEDENAYE